MPRTRYLKRTYEEKIFKTQVHLQLEIIKQVVDLWDKGKLNQVDAYRRFSEEVDDLQRILDRLDKGRHWTEFSPVWNKNRQ